MPERFRHSTSIGLKGSRDRSQANVGEYTFCCSHFDVIILLENAIYNFALLHKWFIFRESTINKKLQQTSKEIQARDRHKKINDFSIRIFFFEITLCYNSKANQYIATNNCIWYMGFVVGSFTKLFLIWWPGNGSQQTNISSHSKCDS